MFEKQLCRRGDTHHEPAMGHVAFGNQRHAHFGQILRRKDQFGQFLSGAGAEPPGTAALLAERDAIRFEGVPGTINCLHCIIRVSRYRY